MKRGQRTRAQGTAHRRFLLVLAAIYAMLWLVLAVDPVDRKDWALENVLVLAFIIVMIASHRHFVFSRISYILIFLFLCLHSVGAHYTYSLVPYDQAWQALTGDSFNAMFDWQRNHYDRLVHFLYGLLLAYPQRELFLRIAEVRGVWGYFLPLDFTLASSAIFELFEWAAAAFFGGDLGVAYLGTQGDVWDAHKDMLLAAAGATVAMLVTLIINLWLQRDFAREWADSLRIKQPRPLGEDEIKRMLKN